MSADTAPLTKVDSAVHDGDADSPIQKKGGRRASSAVEDGDAALEKKISHRRTSSTVSGVFNINDLGESSLC